MLDVAAVIDPHASRTLPRELVLLHHHQVLLDRPNLCHNHD